MKLRKFVIALSLILATTLGTTRRTEAFVGFTAWNPVLMGAGLASTCAGLGGAAVFGLPAQYLWETGNVFSRGGAVVLGAVAGVFAVASGVGMIILSDDKVVGIEFSEVTPNMGRQLGVSVYEAAAFNREIDQVNIITAQVANDLAKIEKPSLEDASEAWARYVDLVEPATLKVMNKMFGKLLNQ